MNELANEVKAHEIHERAVAYFKASEQFGYKFLMELKVIRDEKLFLEFGCNDFEDYTKVYFGYSRDTINERIQAATVWGESYTGALRSLGKTKTRQLAQFPEAEREKITAEGIPTEDGMKQIEDATTREIEEYKKRYKRQAEALREKEAEIARLKQQPPKTVEVEKKPADYYTLQGEVRAKRNEVSRLQQELNHAKSQLQNSQAQAELGKTSTELVRRIQKLQDKEETLAEKLEAMDAMYDLKKEFTAFFDTKMSPMRFKPITAKLYGTTATEDVRDLVDLAQAWVDEMEKILPQRNLKIIEGEIIHD